MKNTYYFPHDYHARNDPKMSALISRFGYEGYGLWWAIVELLHEQGGRIKKFPKLFEGLAHELKQNEAVLEALVSASISDFQLLFEDSEYIWSERVVDNMNELTRKRLQKVDAGRLGGIKSGENRSRTKHCLKQTKQTKQSKVNNSIYNIRDVITKLIGVKGWDKDNTTLITDIYKRHARAAKSLLELAGSSEAACLAIDRLSDEFKKKNLDWTLETVLKWYPELSKKPVVTRGDV